MKRNKIQNYLGLHLVVSILKLVVFLPLKPSVKLWIEAGENRLSGVRQQAAPLHGEMDEPGTPVCPSASAGAWPTPKYATRNKPECVLAPSICLDGLLFSVLTCCSPFSSYGAIRSTGPRGCKVPSPPWPPEKKVLPSRAFSHCIPM